jgi:hypothetical protein
MASDLDHVKHPDMDMYLLLTILILGLKQLGIDIDVFLEPLMQEMERLWRHGEPMYDAFRKEDFICRAMIFVTTNYYPALFALFGQIKGKTGCLVCLDGTTWVYLDVSKKIVYLRYRRFLKTNHKFCSKIYFRYYDNKAENEPPPERRKNRQHVFEMVKTYVSSSEKRIRMGQRKIEAHLLSPAYLSRNYRSSFSICLIDQTWRSPMPLMLCTCRRMSLRVSLLP